MSSQKFLSTTKPDKHCYVKSEFGLRGENMNQLNESRSDFNSDGLSLNELVSSAYGYLKRAGRFVKDKGAYAAGTGLLAWNLASADMVNAADNVKDTTNGTEISQQANELKVEWKPAKLIGSLYAEGSYFDSDTTEENPVFANLDLGYNILGREINEGVLLFPNARLHVKKNKSDFYWDNHVDASIGAALLKPPFKVGADVGIRESFEEEGVDDEFFRAWGAYWDNWVGRPLVMSDKYPFTPEIIKYGEAEFSTLNDNLIGLGRLEGNLLGIQTPNFSLGPFVAAKVNLDTEDEPWNRYGQLSGGLKARLGRFTTYLEYGHRESFNDGVGEGDYISASIAVFKPLEFLK